MSQVFYFLEEDYHALGRIIAQLKNDLEELGKKQGIAVAQSTENMGHDDAVQETITTERTLLILKLSRANGFYNQARVIVSHSRQKGDSSIRIGSIVTINQETIRIGSYQILATHRLENISYMSPLEQALMGHREGDIIHFREKELVIKKVKND